MIGVTSYQDIIEDRILNDGAMSNGAIEHKNSVFPLLTALANSFEPAKPAKLACCTTEKH